MRSIDATVRSSAAGSIVPALIWSASHHASARGQGGRGGGRTGDGEVCVCPAAHLAFEVSCQSVQRKEKEARWTLDAVLERLLCGAFAGGACPVEAVEQVDLHVVSGTGCEIVIACSLLRRRRSPSTCIPTRCATTHHSALPIPIAQRTHDVDEEICVNNVSLQRRRKRREGRTFVRDGGDAVVRRVRGHD